MNSESTKSPFAEKVAIAIAFIGTFGFFLKLLFF